ncbi:2TM domain-containing protein [Ottowia testudinis]|uniref:2TM domain-containing protein n=1 Tax=Ottowia testudinis TaxID=2816950 RepID=A0A975H1L1_9BURK|nr:2TM domain-containing protein [Ottowia testudinis]QTD43938.1 2TM domain-containing protein [Ottowia testudinis]
MNRTAPMTDQQLDRLARKRASAKMGWFIHAFVYLCVNAGLALLAWGGGRDWHLFPLAGWGLGLAIHGLAVWLGTGGSGLHDRLVQAERERLAGK